MKDARRSLRNDSPTKLVVARTDVPTRPPTTVVERLRQRVDIEESGFCVVVDDDRIVHGLVPAPGTSAAVPQAMAERCANKMGPTTTRPDTSLEAALDRMGAAGVDFLRLTTGLGELVGFLTRADCHSRIEADAE